MPNPYTTSTVDSSDYKQLITGRTDDIAAFLDHFAQGHSMALFGERRIGKTSLLFLIRDIITGQVEHYRPNLVDLTLKSALDTLKAKAPSQAKAIHLNLLPVSKYEQETLARTIHSALCEQGLLPPPTVRRKPASTSVRSFSSDTHDDSRSFSEAAGDHWG